MQSAKQVFSTPPNLWAGHRPSRAIYGDGGRGESFKLEVETPFAGFIPADEYTLGTKKGRKTRRYKIAVNRKGSQGIPVLKLHGVPTNRWEWTDVDLSPWCQDVAIDMLGMGDSDKPLSYGKGETPELGKNPWDWINDIDYIEQVMQELFPDTQFVFVASDWGGGIALHYAARYPDRLAGLVLVDPIALDGYPVSEIQAIGRASALDDASFQSQMGAVDQTMVQIFKTMVFDPNVFNQYRLRDLKRTYIDVDYERSVQLHGEDADSMTLRLKYNNLRVLADRAAVLAPAQLLPVSENPRGVDYSAITAPTLIVWGEKDNMMPANQAYRLMYLLDNAASVQIQMIGQAGHFAELDQPDRVTEVILAFIVGTLGSAELAQPFLGLTGIWKGDEAQLLAALK